MKRSSLICRFTLAFCLACACFFTIAWAEENSEERVFGFRILDSREYKSLGASATLYEHVKSGARLIHWKNDDKNKCVEMSYKTFPEDDGGACHIVEHCVCSGSEKYPDDNLFFNLSGKASLTYLNAFTSFNRTCYVASSTSENQLLKITDMFMDSSLHPKFLKDEMIFKREARRFELKSESDPIRLNGTVYNEMKSCYENGGQVFLDGINSALDDGSSKLFSPGGDPKRIKDVTYESVVNTWKKYYHPSNCFIFLYGDLNCERFLESLDGEYLSKYERRNAKVEEPVFVFKSKPVDVRLTFPAQAGENGRNECGIVEAYYARFDDAWGNVGSYEALADAFNRVESPFSRAMRENFPDSYGGVACSVLGDFILLYFEVVNVGEDRKEDFNRIVRASIEEVKSKGFGREVMRAFDSNVPSNECRRALELESLKAGSGLRIANRASLNWATGDLRLPKEEDLNVEVEEKTLIEKLSEITADENHRAVAVLAPDCEMLEREKKELELELDAKKKSMTSDQIEGLIQDSEEYWKWVSKGADLECVRKLAVVGIEDLNVKIPKKNFDEVKCDGGRTKIICSNWGCKPVYKNKLFFGLGKLSEEDKILAEVAAYIIDENVRRETGRWIREYVLDFWGRIGKFYKDGRLRDGICFSWYGLKKRFEDDLGTVRSYVTGEKLGNTEDVKSLISRLKSDYLDEFRNNPCRVMINRGRRFQKGKRDISVLRSSFDKFKFLEDLEKEAEKDPDRLLKRISGVMEEIVSSGKILDCVLSGGKNLRRERDVLERWTSETRRRSTRKTVEAGAENSRLYSKYKIGAREALALEGDLQSNGIVASVKELNRKFGGKLDVLCGLVLEGYLIPRVRHEGGAYGCEMNVVGENILLLSSRDPGLAKTFEAYDGVSEYIKNVDITQEDLDRYIVSAYSKLADKLELDNDEGRAEDKICGVGVKIMQKWLDQIKSTTVQDIKDMAEDVGEAIKNGYRFTVGSRKNIMENRDLFDEVICVEDEMKAA